MLGWGAGRRLRRADLLTALLVACTVLAVPTVALGANPAFPGSDPAESPLANTSDDSHFDECEGDDADAVQECQSYFEERFNQLGFSPDSAEISPGSRAFYSDCNPLTDEGDGQLDGQGEDANEAEGSLNRLARCCAEGEADPEALGASATEPGYDRRVPRVWLLTMAIIVVCLIASMVIATIKLS